MGLNSLAFYQIDRYCQIEKVNFEKREISENSKKMLEQDLAGEDLAITLYKELIKMAEDLGEYANRRIFEEILIEEEENKRDLFFALGK
jgi:bacterioferritin